MEHAPDGDWVVDPMTNGDGLYFSINPYTRKSDAREVLLSRAKLKLLCSSYSGVVASQVSLLE